MVVERKAPSGKVDEHGEVPVGVLPEDLQELYFIWQDIQDRLAKITAKNSFFAAVRRHFSIPEGVLIGLRENWQVVKLLRLFSK